MLQQTVQVRLFTLIMMILAPVTLCVAVEERVRKDERQQRSSEGFCFYDHASSGALITQARITAAINEDYSNLPPQQRPTIQSIVQREFARDRAQFGATGLIGYINRDSRVKTEETAFLESVGFSAKEIEKLLAPF